MSELSEAIKELYEDMSDEESIHVSNSLLNVFKTLQKIEKRIVIKQCKEDLGNEDH